MSKKRGAVLVDFALGAVEPEALAGQELEQRGGLLGVRANCRDDELHRSLLHGAGLAGVPRPVVTGGRHRMLVGGSMSAFRSATTDSSRGIGDLVQTIAARCAAGRTSPEFQISYGQYSFTAIAVGRIGICDSDWRCGRTPASSSMRETRGRLGAAHSRLARPSVQAGGDRASSRSNVDVAEAHHAPVQPVSRAGPTATRARGGSSLAR